MITQVSEAILLTEAPPEAIRVECIDNAWGLTALRPQWNELLRASAANGPFLTWEWLHSWWTHLHGDAALKVIAVRDGNDLIAIAPLMITPGAVPWFSRLEFLGRGHAGSDYLDVIVRIGRETEALRAIARFLETRKMALRLDHLPEGSLGAQLAERLASEGWAASTAPDGVCPVIALGGHTWDSYLATLGSAHRANVRRRLRGAAQQFNMRFEQVTTDSGRREALEALAGFHERRFRTGRGSTTFLTPALRAFQDDATRRALDRGWLRMYVLWLDDVPAAVMYGFLYNRQFYFYQHGFDDRYSHAQHRPRVDGAHDSRGHRRGRAGVRLPLGHRAVQVALEPGVAHAASDPSVSPARGRQDSPARRRDSTAARKACPPSADPWRRP